MIYDFFLEVMICETILTTLIFCIIVSSRLEEILQAILLSHIVSFLMLG